MWYVLLGRTLDVYDWNVSSMVAFIVSTGRPYEVRFIDLHGTRFYYLHLYKLYRATPCARPLNIIFPLGLRRQKRDKISRRKSLTCSADSVMKE